MSEKPVSAKKHITGLREFLDVLDDMDELRQVGREVDTNLEIGAVIRRTHETYAPAPLFTNIRDHAGYGVVGAPLSYSSLPGGRGSRSRSGCRPRRPRWRSSTRWPARAHSRPSRRSLWKRAPVSRMCCSAMTLT